MEILNTKMTSSRFFSMKKISIKLISIKNIYFVFFELKEALKFLLIIILLKNKDAIIIIEYRYPIQLFYKSTDANFDNIENERLLSTIVLSKLFQLKK